MRDLPSPDYPSLRASTVQALFVSGNGAAGILTGLGVIVVGDLAGLPRIISDSIGVALAVLLGGVLAFDAYRRETDRRVIQPLRTGRNFIDACAWVVRNHSEILILAKTPVLLLERDRQNVGRERYAQQMIERLTERPGAIHIRYMFDIDGFLEELKKDISEGKPKRVQDARDAIQRFQTMPGLELSWVRSEPLTSVVFGNGEVVAIALRTSLTEPIVYGVLVRDLSLVRVVFQQYDRLWSGAHAVDARFWGDHVEPFLKMQS